MFAFLFDLLAALGTRHHLHVSVEFITLRKVAHAIYRAFFTCKNLKIHKKIFDIFLIFAQNIHCGCTLEPPRTSTHNLCFGAKIRKIGIPLHTPVLLYKSGVQGGIHYTDMFS